MSGPRSTSKQPQVRTVRWQNGVLISKKTLFKSPHPPRMPRHGAQMAQNRIADARWPFSSCATHLLRSVVMIYVWAFVRELGSPTDLALSTLFLEQLIEFFVCDAIPRFSVWLDLLAVGLDDLQSLLHVFVDAQRHANSPVNKNPHCADLEVSSSIQPVLQERFHQPAELTTRFKQPHLHPASDILVNIHRHLHIVRVTVLRSWPSNPFLGLGCILAI